MFANKISKFTNTMLLSDRSKTNDYYAEILNFKTEVLTRHF